MYYSNKNVVNYCCCDVDPSIEFVLVNAKMKPRLVSHYISYMYVWAACPTSTQVGCQWNTSYSVVSMSAWVITNAGYCITVWIIRPTIDVTCVVKQEYSHKNLMMQHYMA